MKSRKGFTLIELLAVIVILAIIALIAIPQILGVIETARKGAAKDSALGYVDAVEKSMMLAMIGPDAATINFNGEYTTTKSQGTEAGTYELTAPSTSATNIDVQLKGTLPDEGGKVCISGNAVAGARLTFNNGSHKVYVDANGNAYNEGDAGYVETLTCNTSNASNTSSSTPAAATTTA